MNQFIEQNSPPQQHFPFATETKQSLLTTALNIKYF